MLPYYPCCTAENVATGNKKRVTPKVTDPKKSDKRLLINNLQKLAQHLLYIDQNNNNDGLRRSAAIKIKTAATERCPASNKNKNEAWLVTETKYSVRRRQ